MPDSNVDKRKPVLAPLSARDADGFSESAYLALDLNERRGHLPIDRAGSDGGGQTQGAVRPPASRSEIASGLNRQAFAPLLTMILLGLSGCDVRGAPSFVLFGAFFPAWMFCAALGILAGIVARAVFVATGLAHVLPLQLLVCASIGVCAGLLAGLFWFEQ